MTRCSLKREKRTSVKNMPKSYRRKKNKKRIDYKLTNKNFCFHESLTPMNKNKRKIKENALACF